jgi:hypothetical protein
VRRLGWSILIWLLRQGHIVAMQRYRATNVDEWREIGLALAYAETQARIRRDRLRLV